MGESGSGGPRARSYPSRDARSEVVRHPIRVEWLGRVGYQRGLDLQQEILDGRGPGEETLLLLEHDPVFTTGRGGHSANLPRLEHEDASIPVFRVGRGGDATYHGPGQLVGYALVDLRGRRADLHRFMRSLEGGVIAVLAAYGVAGERWPGRTGVWVSRGGTRSTLAPTSGEGPPASFRKIASIAIGVRRGVSLHGFALNVSVDLERFASIVPCGIAGVEMTSMKQEGLRAVPSVEDVARVAARLVPDAIEAESPWPLDGAPEGLR